MSLTSAERERTAGELAHNAALSGLSRANLVARSRLTPDRFDAALRVEGARPADVWLLRDLLAAAAAEAGQDPVAYTVLTDRMRPSAAAWFGVPRGSSAGQA